MSINSFKVCLNRFKTIFFVYYQILKYKSVWLLKSGQPKPGELSARWGGWQRSDLPSDVKRDCPANLYYETSWEKEGKERYIVKPPSCVHCLFQGFNVRFFNRKWLVTTDIIYFGDVCTNHLTPAMPPCHTNPFLADNNSFFRC